MAGSRIGSVLQGPGEEKFVLTGFLGAGAFGEVYRAENANTGAIAAAKLLPLTGITEPDLRHALLNEAMLAAKISHPNIVEVLHVGEDETLGPFVLMEYVSGQTLEQFLRSRAEVGSKIPLGASVEMMIQIAQGSRAINEKLVHRDIKPDNILISGSRVKITDFGLSKLVLERTRTMTFKGIGPISYMAPEAWQMRPNTPKMDVYSVGLVFHEVLTTQHPLLQAVTDRSNIEAWREVHLFVVPPEIRTCRDDVPRSLAQLLSRMVAKRPSDRPDWDEIIKVLSQAGSEFNESQSLNEILEKAIVRRGTAERERLAEELQRVAEREIQNFYQVSFQQLISRWDSIVEAFNREFQGGRIAKRSRSGMTVDYILPDAPCISFRLFPRHETGIRITEGMLIGGVLMAIDGAVSANILLIQEDEADLYGKWVGCLVKLSVIVDPRDALANLSSQPPSEPFGFQNERDFYEEIRWAGSGAMHIFTYELRHDLDQMFRDFLETAFSI